MPKKTRTPSPPPAAPTADEDPIWGDMLGDFFGVHTSSVPSAAPPAHDEEPASKATPASKQSKTR